jgi:hypothetical protein
MRRGHEGMEQLSVPCEGTALAFTSLTVHSHALVYVHHGVPTRSGRKYNVRRTECIYPNVSTF